MANWIKPVTTGAWYEQMDWFGRIGTGRGL